MQTEPIRLRRPLAVCRILYDPRRITGDGYAAALLHVGNRLLRGLHHCLRTGDTCAEDSMFPPR